MATFKERKRTGAPMDMEKRGVGGQARAAAIKMGKFKPKPQAAQNQEEENRSLAESMGIPLPGVHPAHMQEAARAAGKNPPPAASASTIGGGNPFAALKGVTKPAPKTAGTQTPQPANTGAGKEGPASGEREGKIPKKLPVFGQPRPRDDRDYSRVPTNFASPETEPTVEASAFGDEILVPERKRPKDRGRKLIIHTPSTLSRIKESGEKDGEMSLAGLLSLTETVCDSCPIAETCPEYEEGSLCAYTETLQGFSTRRKEDLLPLLQGLADAQIVRANRALLFEAKLAGGQLSGDVTRQIEVAAQAAIRIKQLQEPLPESRSVTTVSISHEETGPKPGILSQLIAGFLPPQKPKEVLTEGVELNPEASSPPPALASKEPPPALVKPVLGSMCRGAHTRNMLNTRKSAPFYIGGEGTA